MDRGYAEGDLNKVNDRVLHEWLQFAGGWGEKTTTAKLATIRSFEASCSDKAFGKLTKVDVVAYRDSLKASVELTNDKPLSVATVRQRASHLKSFLAWLIDQKGFQGLNKSLPHYCALPKKFNAPSLSERERYIPNLAEAVRMIEGMPVEGIKERRDRAMVAIAFLGALRADTATSLRVKHVERSNKIIVQDAKTARTKNGKSLRIKFFPLPEIFENVVCGWKEELLGIGFSPDDALFPDEKHFVAWRHKGPKDRIRAMSSTHAISQAFELASKPLGEKVSPHAAKHCIGTLSLEVCKTPEELKACPLTWDMKTKR